MKCGQLCGHFVSLPRLRFGHITSGYLANRLIYLLKYLVSRNIMPMTKMDKIWISTAVLIQPNTANNVTVAENQIIQEIKSRFQTTITPIMLTKHLVSWEDRQADKNNSARGGSRNRYLFRTVSGTNPSGGGNFRLYKRADSQHDGWDKTGPTCPQKHKIDPQYHQLVDWYLKNYY